MSTSLVGIGFLELVLLLSGGGIVGMPPGERDPGLIKWCRQKQSFTANGRAARRESRVLPGIDGLAADPEVVSFVNAVKQATVRQFRTEARGDRCKRKSWAKWYHLFYSPWLIGRAACM